MTTFRIDTDTAGTTLAVVGELDAATAPQLRAALEQVAPDVTLELGDCTFMDSSGISVLTEARLRQCPGLTIASASRPVRLVLEISGLAETFLVDDTASPN